MQAVQEKGEEPGQHWLRPLPQRFGRSPTEPKSGGKKGGIGQKWLQKRLGGNGGGDGGVWGSSWCHLGVLCGHLGAVLGVFGVT